MVLSLSLRRLRRPHQLLEQRIERSPRILMHAGVHLGCLDDRAARRDEPMEALALRERCDRARLSTSRADLRNDLQVAVDDREVDRGIERAEALGVELDARVEKPG